jgi:hypothetical protein
MCAAHRPLSLICRNSTATGATPAQCHQTTGVSGGHFCAGRRGVPRLALGLAAAHHAAAGKRAGLPSPAANVSPNVDAHSHELTIGTAR